MQTGHPEEQPAAITQSHTLHPQAVALASCALQALGALERALNDLAAFEPRGYELAATVDIASARLDRHHRRRWSHILAEHLEELVAA